MEAVKITPGIFEVLKPFLRLCSAIPLVSTSPLTGEENREYLSNHHMAVENTLLPILASVHAAADTGYHGCTDGDVRDKVPVHYVDV